MRPLSASVLLFLITCLVACSESGDSDNGSCQFHTDCGRGLCVEGTCVADGTDETSNLSDSESTSEDAEENRDCRSQQAACAAGFDCRANANGEYECVRSNNVDCRNIGCVAPFECVEVTPGEYGCDRTES